MGVGLFTELFAFLIGEGFREGVGVVPILLLSNLFLGLYFNISIWYKVANKTWFGIIYTFTGATLTVILYFTLIPILGYYGAAIAKLVCYILMSIICYIGGQKHYKVPYEINKFLIYIVSAVLLFIPGYFVNIDNYLLSLVFRASLVFIYILVFFRTENISLKSIIKQLKHES